MIGHQDRRGAASPLTIDLCRVKVQLSNTSNHFHARGKTGAGYDLPQLALRHGYISALGRDAKVHPKK